ncbi:MAG: alpha/beta hydrolase [Chromatiales bacterium]|nr:MAG: alpha/beta hydrolase [Chromatiales bacterium]
MKHADGYLDVRHSKARGSSRLYQQSWTPDGDVRAGILLAHGLGEHSSRYTHVAEHLTRRGFAVHTLDHYGHGKSDGLPGYVERFSVYLDGVAALLEKTQKEHPGQPLFLIGHSMGGLIAAAFLLERQNAFRACALSGPAIKSDQAPHAIVIALIRLIAILAPTAPLIQLDASGVSRDKSVVDAYMRDPLVHHGKLSARLLSEMSAAMKTTLARAAEIRIPIILMHGDADQLTAPSGSVELHDRIESDDKTLKLYPGLYHEIFNEPEQDAVLAEMSGWLEAHL